MYGRVISEIRDFSGSKWPKLPESVADIRKMQVIHHHFHYSGERSPQFQPTLFQKFLLRYFQVTHGFLAEKIGEDTD